MLAAATTAAIVTAAVTAIATAAMATAVTVLQTVCTACRPVFTVRDRSSLRNAMLLGSVGVLGETVLGERLRGGGAGAGGQDPEQEPTREQEQGEGGGTCDCGRDCDCDRDCRYDGDCDRGCRNARAESPHSAFSVGSRRGVQGLSPAVQAVAALRDCKS